MMLDRRSFFSTALAAASVSALLGQTRTGSAAQSKAAMPGPWPGRVAVVDHPGCIVSGAYQKEPVLAMMDRGMRELTGAPERAEAWRSLFSKGDVVGIKVSPVGGPTLSSDALVLNEVIRGLNDAGVANKDIIVFSRYKREIQEANIDQWLPSGVRWDAPSMEYDDVQLDMDGYDRDHYMEIALIKPGDDQNDSHFRRSYVTKIVTQRINKLVNLTVLKHHQSAGVTISLKNMSHGMVNNVNRSHLTPTLNACGAFIPSVVSLPVIKQKAVLQICDGVKASYHGGPGAKPKYVWEHKTMYFATDPVALDRLGWKAIDAQRASVGMASIALSKPDNDSHFVNCQVEHIEIAGTLGLGVFDEAKIDARRIHLS